jgi:hypothetical protein
MHTKNNLADAFTKPLDLKQFQQSYGNLLDVLPRGGDIIVFIRVFSFLFYISIPSLTYILVAC